MLNNPVLEIIFSPRYESLIRKCKITLELSDDLKYHRSKAIWRCEQSQKVNTKKTLKLSELTEEMLCLTCFRELDNSHPLVQYKAFRQVQELATFELDLQSCASLESHDDASEIGEVLINLHAIIKRMEELEEENPALGELLDPLKKKSQEFLEEFSQHSQSQEIKESISHHIHGRLLPNWRRGTPTKLYDAPMLIGAYPCPPGQELEDDVLKACIEAYSIRRGDALVLYGPAYLYPYLLEILYLDASGQVTVVSAPAPLDATARENAAYLWDPQSDNSLSCLMEAVRSGQALSD